MAKIGFVGLGNIGKGICKNLIEAGHILTIYDRNPDAMKRFEGKAAFATNGKELCLSSEYIFLSLPSTEIVESMVDEFLEAGVEGKTIIDTSTSYPVSTKNLYHKIREKGGTLIDAALMAGPDEAEAGTLEIVVGGDKDAVEKARFLFDAYCSKVKYVGESGSGHLAKLAVNYCGLLQATVLATVFPIMENYGISPEKLYEILDCEALDNWMFRFYGEKYKKRNYPLDFALILGQKDLTYMKKLFENLNIQGFMLDGALELCREALARNTDEKTPDFSYLCEYMYELIEEKSK